MAVSVPDRAIAKPRLRFSAQGASISSPPVPSGHAPVHAGARRCTPLPSVHAPVPATPPLRSQPPGTRADEYAKRS